jgi:hypothetical protein
MARAPTQKDVDAIASFVEACGELDIEPFFGKDESFSYSGTGTAGKYTFKLGDRFHFRSALISYRRIWMKSESCHWRSVATILKDLDLPVEIADLASFHAESAAALLSRGEHFLGNKVIGSTVIDLWLNTVFAHDGLEGQNKRSDFEALSDQYGHARFEHTFRSLIKYTGEHFRLMASNSAKPALELLEKQFSLRPSFRIATAFGKKRKEITPQDDTIIRQGSTEFFSEESLEARFHRILARHAFDSLKFIIQQFDRTQGEILRALLAATSFPNFLERLDGKNELSEPPKEDALGPDGFCAVGNVHESHHSRNYGRAVISRQCVVITTKAGQDALNRSVSHFQNEFLTD